MRTDDSLTKWIAEVHKARTAIEGVIISSNPSRNGRRFTMAFRKSHAEIFKEKLVNELQLMHLNNLSLGHYEEGAK
jgi:hypothetical protein